MRSRNIWDLHPIVRLKADVFKELCKKDGIEVLIYFTYRSVNEQNKLYQIGRRGVEGERIVTKAKGGESAHNYRAAFDCVPLKDGQPWWDAPDRIWKTMGGAAEKVGLDWMGDQWGEYLPWDKGHFQEPGWKIVKWFLIKEYVR